MNVVNFPEKSETPATDIFVLLKFPAAILFSCRYEVVKIQILPSIRKTNFHFFRPAIKMNSSPSLAG